MVTIDYSQNQKRQSIDELVRNKPEKVLFNLEKARYLSATDLTYFIGIYNAVKDYGGNVGFINANPCHKKLFTLCRLESVFNIEEVKAYV